ncbi:MAG TPA: asparagine synthase C-terminal domain-containing protein, partial [Solirubrobacteraceae bacterium]|nr:asparagine synthase C-terminal domain-containing protein [Solirubrobacteraceae bacterium]
RPARRARRAAGGTEGRRLAPRLARLAGRLAMPPARRYADLFRYFTDADRARMYGPELRAVAAASEPLAHVEAAWASRDGLDGFDRLMATDLETYLADDLVGKVDLASMAHSIEVRSPLLDHELMQWAAKLPVALKANRREGKLLLRDAARAWLPDDVLDRPKQGFGVPIESWLRDRMRTVPEDVLLDPVATERGLFVPAEVERMVREHHDGHDRSQRLWALIQLELWFRTCVDSAAATPSEVLALA